MKKTKKIIYAFIFARQRSIRLKNKNLRKIGRETLIEKSIKIAKKIVKIKKIYVSSDSRSIIRLAKKKNINTILRPQSLCKSNSKEIYSWKHAIRYLEKKGEIFDYFLSLPPTSPLRTKKDIENLIENFSKNKSDITVTVARTNRNPYFNMVQKSRNNYIKFNKKNFQRLGEFFDLTTVGYIAKPSYILKTRDLFYGKVKSVEIPRDRAIDIDDAYDFKLAKLLYKND